MEFIGNLTPAFPVGKPGYSLAGTGYTSAGPRFVAHRGYSPQDFGAVADGTLHPLSEVYPTLAAAQADFPFVTSLGQSRDWVALQQCLTLATIGSPLRYGKNLYVPAGIYYLDATLSVTGVFALTFRGDGQATQLVYHGVNTAGALQIVSCQNCTFSDFSVRQVGQNPAWGIWLTNTSASLDGVVSSGNNFRRVLVDDNHQTCVLIQFSTGGDANNDLHVFEDCIFKNFSANGVFIHGGQVHFLRFLRCSFNGVSNSGTTGINSDFGAFLHVEQCVLNACQTNLATSNFYTGTITVARCNSEGSKSFVNLTGGANCPVTISDCRGAMAPAASTDYVINVTNAALGTLRIQNNNFFTTTAFQPLVLLNFGYGAVIHVGNMYQTGSGGPTWASRGGGALVVGPIGNSGFNVNSLIDLGNLYTDPNGAVTAIDVECSPMPNVPAAMTGDQNEYNPLPGRYQRWSSTQAVAVKGMTGSGQAGAGYQGELREIWNVGSFNITLVNLSANPRHQAEFTTSTGADIVLAPNRMALARYDQTSNSGFGSWRVAGPF